MRRLAWILALAGWAGGAEAQSVLDRSPNLHGTWGLRAGHASFAFAHRFELLNGGDQLINVPTLTLALGLPWGLTAGLAYTSNSEIVARQVGSNETEYWLKRGLTLAPGTAVAGIIAYNGLAESVDGAMSLRAERGRLALMGEARAFSDIFGTGEPGFAAALGAIARVTPYLGISADAGRVLSADSFATVWTAGLSIAIPGSPHTFSLHATNGGAMTLQGASRDKVIGPEAVRYGFEFTVPLGNGSQWARIVRPGPPVPVSSPSGEAAAVQVPIRMIAYMPPEIHIQAGQSVEWINYDPTPHTVTGDDGWASDVMPEGGRYVRRFDQPGRYPYRCLPHPQMTGVVIVDP